MRWDEVPTDYLMWMIGVPDMSEDNKWTAQRIVNDRRRKAVEDAIDVVTKTMKTIESLNEWWLSDTKHRAEHGIVSGTPNTLELVAACAAKKAELQKV
jgi:hypothetical protein